MRLRITLEAPTPCFLPWRYPELLRGFVYSAMRRWDAPLAEAMHNEGLVAAGRRYKPFTFSWLHPKHARAQGEGLVMEPPILWWLSSPLPAVLEALAGEMLTAGQVVLGDVVLAVAQVEVEAESPLMPPVEVETLSPIVVSTAVEGEKGLMKVFLAPWDNAFQRVLTQNLVHKAMALGKAPQQGAWVQLKPLGDVRSRLATVRGIQVRGFEGRFLAMGDALLLRVGYDVGFGERNAQGFGMVRVREG